MSFELKEYVSSNGRNHFRRWLDDLDSVSKAKIQARLFRLELGNLGNSKKLGNGVSELKLDWGPGIRIYFGQVGKRIVLLLCGGDKSTQTSDIIRAKALWTEFLEREKYG